jgi:hypothetical protein
MLPLLTAVKCKTTPRMFQLTHQNSMHGGCYARRDARMTQRETAFILPVLVARTDTLALMALILRDDLLDFSVS